MFHVNAVRLHIAVSAFLVAASLACAGPLAAQKSVPVREAIVTQGALSEPFDNIFGARELRGGHVLVNDGVRHQLIELDRGLARVGVVLDSVAVNGNGYGPVATPFIPYLADSTLFVDGTAFVLLVIDPAGRVARVMAGPSRTDLRFLAGAASGADNRGRLLYRVSNIKVSGDDGKPMQTQQLADSASIVRLDLDTRKVDTIARVKEANGSRATRTTGGDGKRTVKYLINPLESFDEWAVLADGTVAVVRGYDYHVDLLRTDGARASGEKIPYPWKQLSDADKQHIVDSLQAEIDHTMKAAEANGLEGVMSALRDLMLKTSPGMGALLPPRPTARAAASSGAQADVLRGASPGAARAAAPAPLLPRVEIVPASELAAYDPPLRTGAALPDLDGNVWILPKTSKESKAGELVYDVVNARGTLFQRVRLPVGRSVAGFGHGGGVFLMHAESGKWRLETARLR